MRITNIWALLALVMVCLFGSPALAQAHTASETLACMKQAVMAEKPLTGTYSQRLAQARTKRAGTKYYVNGARIPTTADKPTAWNLCEGPTLEEQLATAKATIVSQAAEIQRLNTLAYYWSKDASGHRITLTYQDRAAALGTELATAKTALTKKTADAETSGFLIWLFVILGLTVLYMNGKRIRAWSSRTFNRTPAQKPASPVDFGNGDDSPPAPAAGETP